MDGNVWHEASQKPDVHKCLQIVQVPFWAEQETVNKDDGRHLIENV